MKKINSKILIITLLLTNFSLEIYGNESSGDVKKYGNFTFVENTDARTYSMYFTSDKGQEKLAFIFSNKILLSSNQKNGAKNSICNFDNGSIVGFLADENEKNNKDNSLIAIYDSILFFADGKTGKITILDKADRYNYHLLPCEEDLSNNFILYDSDKHEEKRLYDIDNDGTFLHSLDFISNYSSGVTYITKESDFIYQYERSFYDTVELFKIDLVKKTIEKKIQNNIEIKEQNSNSLTYSSNSHLVEINAEYDAKNLSQVNGLPWSDDNTGLLFDKKYESASDEFSVTINENTMIFTIPVWSKEGGVETEIHKSEINMKNGFVFIKNPDDEYMIFTCEINEVNFMTLLSNSVYSDTYVQSFSNRLSYTDSEDIGANYLEHVTDVNASSHVIEQISNKDVHFLPDYSWSFYDNPWAINNKEEIKKISFTCTDHYWDSGYKQMKVDSLVISNGFVMPSKPHLYEQNCRAKTIKLTMNGKSVTHVLEDTPNYQVVKLPESFDPSPDVKVTLEIIDWYQGTKYDDIVIASVSIPIIRLKD